MTKSTKLVLRTLALAGLATSFATHAMQVVQPVKDLSGTNFSSGANATTWTGTAALGSVVTIIGRYTSDVGNESGLGLKVLYDANKFTGVTVTALSTKCMIAPPQIQPNGASSKAVLGWIDTAARNPAGSVGWPYLADPAASSGTPATSPCLSPNTNPANDISTTAPGAVNLFQFQGTLAPAVGAGNTAAVSIVSDGNFSYAGNTPGMADQLVTFTAVAAPNIALVSVVSRKTHSTAGVFDLPLPNYTAAIGGTLDIESRSPTSQPHVIVFQFNAAVTSVGAATISGGTSLQAISGASASTAFNGTEVTVTLTGIPDKQRVQVAVPGVNGALSVAANVGFLLGDVNGSNGVASGDITAVRAASGSSTTASNYKLDVNTSGGITAGDISIIRSQSGASLAP